MKATGHRRTFPAFGFTTLFVLLGTIAGPLPALAQEETLVLEEVIVTATRRTQSLQDVPISVAALSGETLDKMNIRNLEELAVYVPNFSKGESGIGPVMQIRGIASGANQGFEQSVVMYVDDIPLSRAPLARMPLFDLERVEVLRGPQNVLFGKNSIGGAVSFITARPTDELSGRVSVMYGHEYDDYEAIGVISGPMSDTFSGRLSVRTAGYGGYYDNRLNGRTEEDREEQTIRGMLSWQPTDNLDIMFKYEHNSVEGLGLGEEIVDGYRNPLPQSLTNPFGGMNFAEAAGFVAFLTGQDIGSTQVSQDRVRDTNPDEWYDLSMDTAQMVLNWDLNAVTMTSVTGWVEYEEDRLYDGDLSGVDIISQDFGETFEQFSQEIRFTSDSDGPIDWILGAYFQTWEQEGKEVWNIDDENLLTALGALSPALSYFGVMANSVSDKRYRNESDTWAVFGQLGWNVTDNFKLTFGGRYTDETKKGERFLDIYNSVTGQFDIVQAITGACVFNTDYYTLGLISAGNWLPGCVPGEFVEPGGYPIHDINGKISEGQFTPSFIAEWWVQQENLLYFKVDKGFKAGGFDAKGARVKDYLYEPEEVWAYEIGSKNTLAGGAVEFNIAAFYMDYQDLQTSSFDGQSGFVVGNAAKATIKGIEIDSRWQATEKLSVLGALGYLDAKFDEYEGASCNAWYSLITGETVCDRSGQRFAYAPEWAITLGLDWVTRATENFDFRATFDVLYESKYFADSTHEQLLEQDGYAMLNLRLAMESDNWVFAVLGKNLTDEEVIEFGTTVPNSAVYFGAPAYAGFLKPPRTISVQAEYRF
jgi:outer membrane receptor protein involved in Fe transport